VKAAAVVAEVVTVVAETENGVAETVLTLREVSIVVAEATTTTTTEDLEKIKMGSLLRAKSPTVEVAEVVATLTEIEAAEVVTEGAEEDAVVLIRNQDSPLCQTLHLVPSSSLRTTLRCA